MSSFLGKKKPANEPINLLAQEPPGSSFLGRSFNHVPVNPNAVPALPEIDSMVKGALFQGMPATPPAAPTPDPMNIDAMVQQALMGSAPAPAPAMSPMASPNDMPSAMPQRAPGMKPAAPKAEAPAPMNPAIREYIAKKYGFGGDESADALKLEQENAREDRLMSDIGSAGNTIGAAIAGVKADNSFYDKMSAGAGQGVRDLQERRKSAMDDMTYGKALKEQEAEGAEDDLGSNVTKTYQMLANKMLPGKDFSRMSATEIKRLVPSLEKIYSIQSQADARKQMASILAGKQAAKTAAEHSLEGRMAKLGNEGKARLDNAMMAYRAARDMKAALDQGDWTVHPVGDNDFTDAKGRWTEGLGRMQSGGQIGRQEKKDFEGMVPGPLQDKRMQYKKLENAEREMRARLKTLGFTPEELDRQAQGPAAPMQQAHDIDAIDAILKERGEL
ncbi:hypothetical protein UFOVP1351_25 [uncultured Caudovirales phage]|uniref:Uncharacterized protein n=1 Tax=uncultured Caudovirales phage TaxID=2100421 RepID=A0A6J5S3X6_9CAUD|nr:hypothetical protein UFOVP1351_25 [uncultured Caudovirales phage]